MLAGVLLLDESLLDELDDPSDEEPLDPLDSDELEELDEPGDELEEDDLDRLSFL